jgi:hypothetical protein
VSNALLACEADVPDSFSDMSYMTAILSVSSILGLESVTDKWTGLPMIKEKKTAASMSMVGGQGKHLGCGFKSRTCPTGRYTCFMAGLKYNSKCHGDINKNCMNKKNHSEDNFCVWCFLINNY